MEKQLIVANLYEEKYMKKSLACLALVVIVFTGCSQSPESHCEQAIDNTTKIMKNDPIFLLVPEKDRKKMVEELIARKPQGVEDCVESYNKDLVDCAVKAKVKEDLQKCR